MKTYSVYGLRLASEWPLRGYAQRTGAPDATLTRGEPAAFEEARALPPTEPGDWPAYTALPDDGIYLRWGGEYEFLLSADGTRIAALAQPGADEEGFQTYLLGQVISFLLIRRGAEPLHATAVEVGCGAVAFLADSGGGKSTLAAELVAAGARLVTDDLLVTRTTPGEVAVLPGPPRLKLFPAVAARHPGLSQAGRMNALSDKLVMSLHDPAGTGGVPLRVLYLLSPRARSRTARISIRPLEGTRAFRALMAATYNNYVADAGRLQRQFLALSRLAGAVPVRVLSYPRRLDALPRVRERVLADACEGAG